VLPLPECAVPLKLFYGASDETMAVWWRRTWVCPEASELDLLRDWPGIRNVLAIEAIRSVAHSYEVQADIRYYLIRAMMRQRF